MAIRSSIAGDNQLDARGQAVLSAIIKEHFVTGEPVGSRAVSERFCGESSGWSAATVRNVMAELEESGLVEQPHTSAGRVPTDAGYRFYVDHMDVGDAKLSRADTVSINRVLRSAGAASKASNAPGHLMEKVSHLLSELSENVGIVVAPPFAENLLQHIEFVQLADNRILVVMVFSPSLIQNKLIHVDLPLSQVELEQTARYLNAHFTGKSLTAIRAEIVELMREEKALYDKLLQTAVMLCERSLEGEEAATGGVYVDGASNILSKPDFADVRRMREILRTLEEKSRLVEILNECLTRDSAFGGVRVVIGRENYLPSMQNCTFITASYRLDSGEAVGNLGVVGPVRMEYARMMAVVNHVARLIERMLREEHHAA
ncbi:MAG: heat-inducible transcription repressor HrcA [Pyrinomonadaceae bacterium]|nr:heat-inducible transcription repressor HrcA [Pyrinomonadaceae bacterium]